MKKLTVLLAVALIQACAFTDATLDVQHNADASFDGPLGGIEATGFELAALDDNREVTERIGWRKMDTGITPPTSSQPRPSKILSLTRLLLAWKPMVTTWQRMPV